MKKAMAISGRAQFGRWVAAGGALVALMAIAGVTCIAEQQRWRRMRFSPSRIEVLAGDSDERIRILSEVVIENSAFETSMHHVEIQGAMCSALVMPDGVDCAHIELGTEVATMTVGPVQLASSVLAKLHMEAAPEHVDVQRLREAMTDGELVCASCEVMMQSNLFRFGPELQMTHVFTMPLIEATGASADTSLRLVPVAVPEVTKHGQNNSLPHALSIDTHFRFELTMPHKSMTATSMQGFLNGTEVAVNASLGYDEDGAGRVQAAATIAGPVQHWTKTGIWGDDQFVVAVPVTVSSSLEKSAAKLFKEFIETPYNIHENCEAHYARVRQQRSRGVDVETPRTMVFRARSQKSALARLLGERHSVGWCSEPHSPWAHLSQNESIWEKVKTLDQLQRRLFPEETSAPGRKLASVCGAEDRLAKQMVAFDAAKGNSITCEQADKAATKQPTWKKTCCMPKKLPPHQKCPTCGTYPAFKNGEPDMLMVFAESFVIDDMLVGAIDMTMKGGTTVVGGADKDLMEMAMKLNILVQDDGKMALQPMVDASISMTDGIFGRHNIDMHAKIITTESKIEAGKIVLKRIRMPANAYGYIDFPKYEAKIQGSVEFGENKSTNGGAFGGAAPVKVTFNMDFDAYKDTTMEGAYFKVKSTISEQNIVTEGNFAVTRTTATRLKLAGTASASTNGKTEFSYSGLSFEFSDPDKVKWPDMYFNLQTGGDGVSIVVESAGKSDGNIDITAKIGMKGEKDGKKDQPIVITATGSMTSRAANSALITTAQDYGNYMLNVAPFNGVARTPLSAAWAAIPPAARRLAWVKPAGFQGNDIPEIKLLFDGKEVGKLTNGATYEKDKHISLNLPMTLGEKGSKDAVTIALLADWQADGKMGVKLTIDKLTIRANGNLIDETKPMNVEVGIHDSKVEAGKPAQDPTIIALKAAPPGSIEASHGKDAIGLNVQVYSEKKLQFEEYAAECLGNCAKGIFADVNVKVGDDFIENMRFAAKDGSMKMTVNVIPKKDAKAITASASGKAKDGSANLNFNLNIPGDKATDDATAVAVICTAQNLQDRAVMSANLKLNGKELFDCQGSVDNSKSDKVTYDMKVKADAKTQLTTNGELMKKSNIISGPMALSMPELGETIKVKQVRFTNGFFNFQSTSGASVDKTHERMYYYFLWNDQPGAEIILDGWVRRFQKDKSVSGIGCRSTVLIGSMDAISSAAVVEGEMDLDMTVDPKKSEETVKSELTSAAKEAILAQLALPADKKDWIVVKIIYLRRLMESNSNGDPIVKGRRLSKKFKVTYTVKIPKGSPEAKTMTNEKIAEKLSGSSMTTQMQTKVQTKTGATVSVSVAKAPAKVTPPAVSSISVPSSSGDVATAGSASSGNSDMGAINFKASSFDPSDASFAPPKTVVTTSNKTGVVAAKGETVKIGAFACLLVLISAF